MKLNRRNLSSLHPSFHCKVDNLFANSRAHSTDRETTVTPERGHRSSLQGAQSPDARVFSCSRGFLARIHQKADEFESGNIICEIDLGKWHRAARPIECLLKCLLRVNCCCPLNSLLALLHVSSMQNRAKRQTSASTA